MRKIAKASLLVLFLILSQAVAGLLPTQFGFAAQHDELSEFKEIKDAGATDNDALDVDAIDSHLFIDRIVPMLYEKCYSCHGGASKEGGYSLADVEQLFQPGESGASPISVDQPESSEWVVRMLAEDPTVRMPLDSPALDRPSIEAFRRWIASGAKIDESDAKLPLLELYGRTAAGQKAPVVYPSAVRISSMLLDAAGKNLLVAGYSEVLAWNIDEGSIAYRLPTRGRFISDLKWAPGGRIVVASGSPGKFGALEVFDFTSKTRLSAFGFSRDVSTGISASPFRNEVAAGFSDGSVSIFSLESFKPRASSVAHAAGVTSIAWSSRNNRLYSASLDRSGKSYSVDDGRLFLAYSDHERAVGGIVDTQYGPVTLDETGMLRLWSEGEEAKAITKLEGFPQLVQRIHFADGILLVTDFDRIRRISIEQDEVDDDKQTDKDKGESDKPKKKKRTRFKELAPLQSVPEQRILSLTSNATGGVAAGLSDGRVVFWRGSDLEQPTKVWKAHP